MGNAPDAVRRLIDARDITAKTGTVPQRVRRSRSEGLSPVFGVESNRVPSRADRKAFPSPDYKEELLLPAFPNGPCLTIRHSDLASTAPVGQRGIRTLPGPFFSALGWDINNTIDTIRARNWGSVPLFPLASDRAPCDR